MTLLIALSCTTPTDTTLASTDGAVESPSGDPVEEGDWADEGSGGSDDGGGEGGDPQGEDTGEQTDQGPTFETCFAEIGAGGGEGPDYEQFDYTMGDHCYGTDHQDIQGIERVVFLGDSVTVGTPPAMDVDWYRNQLASELSARFGLDEPNWFWENVNLLDGESYVQDSGDFSTCAKWGARTDDLMRDNSQVESCLPEDQRDKTTLVVMTIGSNDLMSLTEGFNEGKSHDELWAETYEYMDLLRESVAWIKEEGRFENGVYVVFANLYEYTDATGDMGSCPAANLAGFGDAITDPALEEMVLWAMEEYMSIAVDTQSDMLFLLETFCGHGYNHDDENGRCYRGADAELWFDLTCIHPNDIGHDVITDMFLSVVDQ